jgi:DNA polymerase III subunit alpha
VLSFYVSGHPLDRYADELKGFTSVPLKNESLVSLRKDATITVGGLVTGLRPHLQRDGRQMAFLKLEDFDGAIELLAFGDAYEKFRHLLAPDAMILVNGQVADRETGAAAKLRVENVMALSDARVKLTRSVHIRLKTQGLEDSFVQGILALCQTFQGDIPLVLHCLTHEGNEYLIRANKGRINPAREALEALRGKLGKENVWLSKKTAG